MQIEEGLRDTKSTHYGLDLASESRIEAEPRANLLLIAALITFALWLTGTCLKGTATERQVKVNSGQSRSPYSVIFLARIAWVAPHLTVVMLPLPLLVAVSAWVDVLGAWMQPKGAGGP